MGADTDVCSILRLHEIREIVLFGFFLVGCVGVSCCVFLFFLTCCHQQKERESSR